MKITIQIFVFFMCFFLSLNIMAREIVISGTIQNSSSIKSFPELSVYMPGAPFIKESTQQWGLLSKGMYDKSSGEYTLNVEIPDNYNSEIIMAVTYLDISQSIIEAYATYPILVNNEQSITLNITLPLISNIDDNTTIHLIHNGIEYNYNRSYRCIIANDSISGNGQMFFLSNHDYVFNKNKINNILPGKYRALCVIRNLFSSTPQAIRKVFDIEIPLADIDLNFDDSGENF